MFACQSVAGGAAEGVVSLFIYCQDTEIAYLVGYSCQQTDVVQFDIHGTHSDVKDFCSSMFISSGRRSSYSRDPSDSRTHAFGSRSVLAPKIYEKSRSRGRRSKTSDDV